MAKKVSNEQIRDALGLIGFGSDILGGLSTSGAQSTRFRAKVLRTGISADDFEKAKRVAALGTPTNAGQLATVLQTAGISPEMFDKVLNAAGIQGKWAAGSVPGTSFAEVIKGTMVDKVPMDKLLAAVGQTISPEAQSFFQRSGGATGTWTTAPPPGAGPIPQATAQKPAPGLPGGPGGTGGGGGGGGGTPAPLPTAQDLAGQAGFQAWVTDVPELNAILNKVSADRSAGRSWSPEALTAEIQKTNWWKQNGINVERFLNRQSQDPAGLKGDIDQKALDVKARANKLGIALSDDRANQIATQAQKWGWDTAQIQSAVGHEFHYVPGQHTVAVDQLTNQARDYLVPLGDQTIQDWGTRLGAGEVDQNQWQQFLKDQAKSMFPSLSGRIDAGETVANIAEPYRQMAAKTLEVDPNSIDFMNPKWMSALDQVDQKTGNRAPMSYSDWQGKLMNDSQYGYDYTNGAKQQATGFAMDILKRFGKVG